MGRAGACGDNAAMESFFALLQKNVPDRQRWSTREQLRLAIITWIERTYHAPRPSRIERLRPRAQLGGAVGGAADRALGVSGHDLITPIDFFGLTPPWTNARPNSDSGNCGCSH